MMEIFIILGLVLLSAFFSGSETALTAISRAKLFNLVKEGRKGAAYVEKLRENKEALIGAILLGNNLVNIAAASLATTVAITWFGVETGPLYATIAMTFLVLIFAEVLPKTIAIHNAEKVSLIVSRPITVAVRLFAPITALVQKIIQLILHLLGIDYKSSDTLASATEAIRGTIELHHSEGEMKKADRDMLGSILDLPDREIEEIMIHRKNVHSIDLQQEPDEIISQAIESAHSRIPLYRDDTDNIVGVLHMKDLLKLVTSGKVGLTREMIRRIANKPWFVPETTSISEQLFAFRQKRQHFACVVDEYGAFQGIVTLEDIIEEIVGEIDDEHDKLEISDIIPFGETAYRVDGTVTIRDLNRHLDWNLPDEHATTVAGLILHEAQMIPDQEAVFEIYSTRFTIAERVNNQITQLIIEPINNEIEEE